MIDLLSRQDVTLYLAVIWIIFVVYWAASAIYDRAAHKAKQVKKRLSWAYFWAPRFVIVIFVIIAIYLTHFSAYDLFAKVLPNSAIITVLGLLIALAGVLFAIWARIYLGGNWSMQVMVKKDHQLVTTGPYAIVRNPIYTGLIAGFLGSFIAIGDGFTFMLFLAGTSFCLVNVFLEQRLMGETFGKEYKDWAKKVKLIIPFIY